MRFSRRNSGPCSSIMVPTGTMPTIVAVPPGRIMRKAFSEVALRPMHSMAWWTPPPVISRTSPTMSCPVASIACVAPNSLARLSLEPTVSMAMIRPAPAMAAPLTADRPTPPQPMMATSMPGSTLAVWKTAPTPVITPQPMSAARSSGMSSRTFTSACSCTSIISA